MFCQSVTPARQGHMSLMIFKDTLNRDKTNLFLNLTKIKVYYFLSVHGHKVQEKWIAVIIKR